MIERCGARTRAGGFCRYYRMPGKRRCRRHGGLGGAPHHPRGFQPIARVRAAARQALMRALGLPWYGGAPKRNAEFKMAEKAIAIAGEVLALLPTVRDVPDSEKGAVELLGEGVREGVILARDTVRLGQMLLDRDGENVDRKILGLANLTALGLTKLGLRAAEGERRDDVLGRLLAAIEAEKAGALPPPASVEK